MNGFRGLSSRMRWGSFGRGLFLLGLAGFLGVPAMMAAEPDSRVRNVLARLDAIYPALDALCIDLHQNPELSFHEEKTSEKMAGRLRRAGFAVTERVGGYGVVGVLRNGDGPVVLLRTDMDALPVEEKTGLAHASRVQVPDASGAMVPVMHACGHDIHMSAWAGTAELLSLSKDSWSGTLVFIAQPAEEKGSGARAMLNDGLLTRFPRPNYALAFHASADLPAGTAAILPGYITAYVDSVDIRIFGRGGHGALPHLTVDPIVIGARTVMALQTIVSREKSPLEPAVITVGSFQGGTKHNVIPDEVHLQLTVRSYKDNVRKQLLTSIERVTKAEAAAAGAPKEPVVTVSEGTPSGYNDPELTARVKSSMISVLGKEKVLTDEPSMVGEDFSQYGRAGIPAAMFWMGTVPEALYLKSRSAGTALPPLHSSHFSPDRESSIKGAVKALTAAALELLGHR